MQTTNQEINMNITLQDIQEQFQRLLHTAVKVEFSAPTYDKSSTLLSGEILFKANDQVFAKILMTYTHIFKDLDEQSKIMMSEMQGLKAEQLLVDEHGPYNSGDVPNWNLNDNVYRFFYNGTDYWLIVSDPIVQAAGKVAISKLQNLYSHAAKPEESSPAAQPTDE